MLFWLVSGRNASGFKHIQMWDLLSSVVNVASQYTKSLDNVSLRQPALAGGGRYK